MASSTSGNAASSTASRSYPLMAGGAPATSLRWLGHSTFMLTSATGTKVLMDPAPQGYGYDGPALEGVDAVTVTHEHPDHANVGLAAGSPVVLRGLSGGDCVKIDQKVKDVSIGTIATAHDDTQGSQRGKNTVFTFEADGMRIAHLGDLGHLLSPEQVSALKPVDVLLVPVGGVYTIDSSQATQVAQQLEARVVVPIHYKTARMRPEWPGGGVEDFLSEKKVQRVAGSVYSITKGTLPREQTVVLLNLE